MEAKNYQNTNPTGIYKGRYPSKNKGIKNWKNSAYFYWFEFLKRNDKYIACCENGGKGELRALYKDFGDIRNMGEEQFWDWFGYREKKGAPSRGELLIKEKPMPTVKVIKKEEWEEDYDKQMYMVVVVNLDKPKRHLQKMFSQRVDTMRKRNEVVRRKGRVSMGEEYSTAKYKIAQNYNIQNLKRLLKVYDSWIANSKLPKKDRLPHWKLAPKIGFSTPNILRRDIRDSTKFEVIKGGKWKDYTKDEIMVASNSLNSAFSRALKEARLIIENTSKGQFPNKVLQK